MILTCLNIIHQNLFFRVVIFYEELKRECRLFEMEVQLQKTLNLYQNDRQKYIGMTAQIL